MMMMCFLEWQARKWRAWVSIIAGYHVFQKTQLCRPIRTNAWIEQCSTHDTVLTISCGGTLEKERRKIDFLYRTNRHSQWTLTNVTKSLGVCGWWMESIECRKERVVVARSPSVLCRTIQIKENSEKKCLRALTEIYSSRHTILVALVVVNAAFQSVTERTAPSRKLRISFDRSLLRVARRAVDDWVVQVLCWSVSTTWSCNRY